MLAGTEWDCCWTFWRVSKNDSSVSISSKRFGRKWHRVIFSDIDVRIECKKSWSHRTAHSKRDCFSLYFLSCCRSKQEKLNIVFRQICTQSTSITFISHGMTLIGIERSPLCSACGALHPAATHTQNEETWEKTEKGHIWRLWKVEKNKLLIQIHLTVVYCHVTTCLWILCMAKILNESGNLWSWKNIER